MIAERADQGQRDRDHRDQHRARRAEEGEDHQHDDDQRLDQRHRDLVDRGVHEVGRVVDDAALEALRQLRLRCRETHRRTPLMTVRRFAVGAIWMPMNTPVLPLKATRAS